MIEIQKEWKENLPGLVYQVFDDEIEGCRVSTIFCRAASALWSEKDWFETMIFDLPGPSTTTKDGIEHHFTGFPEYQKRCSTLEEAKEQHQRAIEYVKEIPEWIKSTS